MRDVTRARARHDSGSLGRRKYASRALAAASVHFLWSIKANASRACRRDCQALIAPPIERCSEVDSRRPAHTRLSRREKRTGESVGREFLPAESGRDRLCLRGRACPPESLRGRDGCFGTRDVYYGVTADATEQHCAASFWGARASRVLVIGVARETRSLLSISPLRAIEAFSAQVASIKRGHAQPTRETRVLAPAKDYALSAAVNAARQSIAAAETSTAQERRAARPRQSRAQERSCHLSGYYR